MIASGQWDDLSEVGRAVHGIPNRVDRLTSLGNAVIPQIPEMIGRAILALEADAYDATEDHKRGWDACLAAVRERMAAGGPGWTPK